MFALLEHETPTADRGAAATPGVHWDLLIQVAGQPLLPTWRLAANPLATPGPVPAERIGDHRPLYLDYEGEISGGRGRVRRLDRGPATIEHLAGAELRARLEGQHLAGRVEIARDPDGRTVFRHSRAPAPGRG